MNRDSFDPLHEDEFEPETSSEGRHVPYLMGGAFAFVVYLFAVAAVLALGVILLLAR